MRIGGPRKSQQGGSGDIKNIYWSSDGKVVGSSPASDKTNPFKGSIGPEIFGQQQI